MEDIPDLTEFSIPRLRNILQKEGGSFLRSDTKKQLIEKIEAGRKVAKYGLEYLPREILNVLVDIGSFSPTQVADLCTTSTNVSTRCEDILFWSEYFSQRYKRGASVISIHQDFALLLRRLGQKFSSIYGIKRYISISESP